MPTYTKKLTLKLGRVTRAFPMHDAVADDRECARVWREARTLLRSRTLPIDFGGQATIDLRWKSTDETQPSKVQIQVSLSTPAEVAPSSQWWLLNGVVESYLMDVFIAMNLACPASFSLFQCELSDETKKTGFSNRLAKVSNYLFDAATTTDYDWPPVSYLRLDAVLDWLQSVRPVPTQKPASRMERALFAIMHLSLESPTSPVSAVWLAHTLECLFDSKPGVTFNNVAKRVSILHRVTPKQASFAKKNLQEIYNLRNGFVHGGADFVHPLRLEFFDQHLEVEASRMYGATDFGFRLILSTFQTVIRRGWTTFSFSEVLRAERVPKK